MFHESVLSICLFIQGILRVKILHMSSILVDIWYVMKIVLKT
jgi:hypothetical protein